VNQTGMPYLVPCMGGWCAQRERCAHYHAAAPMKPAERLCPKDEEQPEPIKQQKEAA